MFLIVGCGSPPPIPGTLMHGLTGEPVANLRVIARAVSDASLTCQVFEAETDAQGAFTLKDLCADVRYALSDAQGALWFEGAEVTGGSASPVALKAWWGPAADGVHLWRKDGTAVVRVVKPVSTEAVGDVTVLFPKEITDEATVVAPGSWLVLTGKAAEEVTFEPVIGAVPKRWWYFGHDFSEDGTPVRREVKPDAKRAREAAAGPNKARYLPHDALPEGRYAILDKERDAYALVDFGKSQAGRPDPWPPEPVAEGEEGAAPATPQ